MTILYSDIEPLSQYSPVKLHLSPATRILGETLLRAMVFQLNLKCENFKPLAGSGINK